MLISFLSQIAPFCYLTWRVLLVARLISNYHIYRVTGREEFQGSHVGFWFWYRSADHMLVFFTFRWIRFDMEGEDPEAVRWMRISNILHIVFIVHSVIAAAVWICLYGKH